MTKYDYQTFGPNNDPCDGWCVVKYADNCHPQKIAEGLTRNEAVTIVEALAKVAATTEYETAKQEAAAWRERAASGDHCGRGFCLTQSEKWEARAAIAKATV